MFDSSAFNGVPIPHWDKGYVISRNVETFASGTPNVFLYGKDGNLVRRGEIWFPESLRVAITSAAVTADGKIVASGEADKANGTRAPFIALTDLSGKVTDAIQTTDFYPRNVCVAPDNTAWSFGGTWWDEVNQRPLPGDLLRHFDFRKGQLAGYIPRSTFPESSSPDSPTLMHCTSTGVAIFSGPQQAYILMAYQDAGPHVYDAAPPAGLMLMGLGLLGPGDAYGLLIHRGGPEDPRQGLYSLRLDDTAKAVRWVPIEGGVGPGTSPGTVVGLWGSDGEYLVLRRAKDPAGIAAVHWAMVTER
jgi:hypothetical protein